MTQTSYEIFVSFVFLLLTKIVSYFVTYQRVSMFNKSGSVLTSIPEKEEEEQVKKWVPKKKHEVLKAKYKCLKKLFQIYDASVIGILPETYENEATEDERRPRSRRKRSHRTKTDACAGTTEVTSGDITDASETDKASTLETAVMHELKMTQCSYTSTQMDSSVTKFERYTPSQVSRTDVSEKESDGVSVSQTQSRIHHQPVPYVTVNAKPKLTRFQCFLHRILGIRYERSYKNYVHQTNHIYAASDNDIFPICEKRKRRGLRFRKLRRLKKVQSDSALRGAQSPTILSFVQSVQKNCLMDTTPRQCPIVGCKMIFYGIINYNDHLNLCHFTERKFVCHYCHEGFQLEYEKCLHENEHLGIPKLTSSLPPFSQQRKASITQTDPELGRTDVPEDKLKKIVSFFDKISDPEQMLSRFKKNRCSESNLHSCKDDAETSVNSTTGPLTCRYCGENFHFRRHLSLHVDLEHRVHDKYSKFHSCAGIVNPRPPSTAEDVLSKKTDSRPSECTLRRKSDESLSYEPSTDIVYCTSMESVDSRKKTGLVKYKWEPGTKIIRV